MRKPNSDTFYVDLDLTSLLLVEAVPGKSTGTLKSAKKWVGAGREGSGREYQLNTSGKVPSEGPSCTTCQHDYNRVHPVKDGAMGGCSSQAPQIHGAPP